MSGKKPFGFGTFFFGFIFAILTVLVTGYFIKDFYDQQRFEDILETSPYGADVRELEDRNAHPLYYSTESIWVEAEEVPNTFMDHFGEMDTSQPGDPDFQQQIVEKLLAQAEECGTTVNEEELLAKIQVLWAAEVHDYSFIPSDSDESEAWNVTLVRNDGLYEDLESFKADFNVCSVGSGMNPVRMNKNWLMFYGSCSGAYAEEPTTNTCSDVREAIEPTLEFN